MDTMEVLGILLLMTAVAVGQPGKSAQFAKLQKEYKIALLVAV